MEIFIGMLVFSLGPYLIIQAFIYFYNYNTRNKLRDTTDEVAVVKTDKTTPVKIEKYYIVLDGNKKGPYALSQLRKMWDSGAITMDTKYASEGMAEWADISKLLESSRSHAKKRSTRSWSKSGSSRELRELEAKVDSFRGHLLWSRIAFGLVGIGLFVKCQADNM